VCRPNEEERHFQNEGARVLFCIDGTQKENRRESRETFDERRHEIHSFTLSLSLCPSGIAGFL